MDNDKIIKVFEKEQSTLIGKVNDFEIKCQDDVNLANIYLKELAVSIKNADKKRKELVGPLNLTVKKLNTAFKVLVQPLEQAKSELSAKVMAWRKIAQAKDRIKEKMGKVIVRHDTTSTRKNWKWKVKNQNEIPSEWFILDEKKINAAVKAGERNIPGLEIYEDEIMVIK